MEKKEQKKLVIGFIAFGELTAKYLPYFLESLRAQSFRDFSVFVQDNTEKKDNYNKFVFVQAYPEVEYEWSGMNLGFARAYNLLVKRAIGAGAEYFLALNPDMLLEPEAVGQLVEAMEKDGSLASAAPKILRWDFPAKKKTAEIDSCGLRELSALRFVDIGQGECDRGQFDNMEIIGPSGAAALYRLSALEKIKHNGDYFDSRMFMYIEDCDLAYRLKQAGFRSKLVPEAKVYHDRTAQARGESDWRVALNRRNKSKQVKAWSFLNKHILFAKHWSGLSLRGKGEVLWYALKMFVFALLFEPYLLKEYGKAWKARNNNQ